MSSEDLLRQENVLRLWHKCRQPPVRFNICSPVRAQIAVGVYETEQRVGAAVTELLADLHAVAAVYETYFMNEKQLKELTEKWQARVQSDVLRIKSIETVYMTGHHPFTVGPKHVVHASDHYSGMLGDATIRAIPCARCHKPYDDSVHKGELVCYLEILKECVQKELTDVIYPIRDEMASDGVEGFAFLNHRLITDWGKTKGG